MSGSIWNSESSLAMHAARRNARNFRNANDPLRGQPVPPEPPLRRQRRQRCIYRVTPGDPASFDLEKIADPENLALNWRQQRSSGGHAPGVDGMTFDVSPSTYTELMRNLSRALRNRRYVPAPTRSVRIPKPSGGHRTLEIPTVIDRVVGAALSEALRPVLVDRLPRHYGTEASCHAILGHMCVMAEDHDWHWLGIDDIKNFYPSVRRELAMETFFEETYRWGVTKGQLYRQGIPWLAAALIYANDGDAQAIGLGQGSSFSPLAASIVLKKVLDLPMDQRIENRMILSRFVDNIHIQGQDRSDVRSAMNDAQTILNEHGMTLKDGGTITIDVRQPTDQTILGVTPEWRNNKLLFTIPESKWKELEETLNNNMRGNGSERVRSIIQGFTEAFRPTYRESADDPIGRMVRALRTAGIYSIPECTITQWVQAGRQKWNSELTAMRDSIRHQATQTLH